MVFRRLRISLSMLAVLSASSFAVAQGRLGGLRDDVRSAPVADSDDDHDDHHPSHGGHHDDHHHHGSDHDLTAKLAFVALTSPWWLPHTALDDDLYYNGYFGRYPYDLPQGYMICAPSFYQEDGKEWSGQFRAEYGNEFDDLSHIGGHLLLDTAPRFGIDSEFYYRQENLVGGGHDELWTGDFNLLYRFAQSEHVAMRSGVGVNWLSDSIDTDFGFNFTYGIDILPCRPWIFSSTIDWGSVGEADLFHFRSTAGVNIRNVEVYIGYDHYNVGGFETDSLISGLRFWF